MIVYHGSSEIIKNSDVIHSKKYLDFGRGLYITTFENQAKKWTVRKGMRRVLSFEKENEPELFE